MTNGIPSASDFGRWADNVHGLVLRVEGDHLVMTGERREFFSLDGLDAPGAAPDTGGPVADFTGEGWAPFLGTQDVLVPFTNPLFWGNFCSIKTSNGQIFGSDSPCGWRGTVDEQFGLCSLTIQNVLNVNFSSPSPGAALQTEYSLNQALNGGMTVNQGFMRTAPLLTISRLEGLKTFNFAPGSTVGKIIAVLPREVFQKALALYLIVNLLEYTFRVSARILSQVPPGAPSSPQDLAAYYDALSSLGFDPIKGEIVALPSP
jgi:hypothetical protein